MTKEIQQNVDEDSSVWKVPERDAFGESILAWKEHENHLGVALIKPGSAVIRKLSFA